MEKAQVALNFLSSVYFCLPIFAFAAVFLVQYPKITAKSNVMKLFLQDELFIAVYSSSS